MLKIDGEWFDVPVISLTRKAEFLDKYANRSESGILYRELIGVYINFQLQLGGGEPYEYNRLWNKLTEPEEFHSVTVPSGKGSYTFTAYFADIKDSLVRQYDGENHWRGLTVNFIARSPAKTGGVVL